jgi:hypothetical protein
MRQRGGLAKLGREVAVSSVAKQSPPDEEPVAQTRLFGELAPVKRRVPLFKIERTVLETHRLCQAGQLDLARGFRPEALWTSVRQSRLVESVLLRMPLPAIYVAEALDGSMRLIDGLERLTSLSRFFGGELSLNGLPLLPELNGNRFRDLEIRMRRRYEDTLLTVVMLGAAADRRLVLDVFDRMNAWKPLGPEEARGFLDAQTSGRSG